LDGAAIGLLFDDSQDKRAPPHCHSDECYGDLRGNAPPPPPPPLTYDEGLEGEKERGSRRGDPLAACKASQGEAGEETHFAGMSKLCSCVVLSIVLIMVAEIGGDTCRDWTRVQTDVPVCEITAAGACCAFVFFGDPLLVPVDDDLGPHQIVFLPQPRLKAGFSVNRLAPLLVGAVLGGIYIHRASRLLVRLRVPHAARSHGD